MRSPKLAGLVGAVAFVVVLAPERGLLALGQPGEAAQQAPVAPPDASPDDSKDDSKDQGSEVLPEAIPEGIELTEGSGHRYAASGRRDPFVSLALGLDVLAPDVRPPGLAGMLIQEVSLRGIVKTADGYIAMIQGTDKKSYFATVGERLYDGNIQSIIDEKVVFRQEIDDPLRIDKFQQVEKTLHPVEEGIR